MNTSIWRSLYKPLPHFRPAVKLRVKQGGRSRRAHGPWAAMFALVLLFAPGQDCRAQQGQPRSAPSVVTAATARGSWVVFVGFFDYTIAVPKAHLDRTLAASARYGVRRPSAYETSDVVFLSPSYAAPILAILSEAVARAPAKNVAFDSCALLVEDTGTGTRYYVDTRRHVQREAKSYSITAKQFSDLRTLLSHAMAAPSAGVPNAPPSVPTGA